MNSYAVITDASCEIGYGHAVRQISLALQAINIGMNPFILSQSDYVEEMCLQNRINFIKATSFNKIIKLYEELGFRRLIVDVHEKDFSQFRDLCNKQERSILLVSEVGSPFKPFGNYLIRMGSDLHEWKTKITTLNNGISTKIYSGRAWIIFSNEFQQLENYNIREENRIIIAHGGSDPYGLTKRCIMALEKTIRTWNIYVLVTSAYTNINKIYSLAGNSKHNYNIILNTKEIAKLMSLSTVGIINGGNVRYEMCITGTPFIALSYNILQYICTDQITKQGAGINIGSIDDIDNRTIVESVEKLIFDKQRRKNMQMIMRELFDLKAGERILNLMKD